MALVEEAMKLGELYDRLKALEEAQGDLDHARHLYQQAHKEQMPKQLLYVEECERAVNYLRNEELDL
jgi:hypothetical protein